MEKNNLPPGTPYDEGRRLRRKRLALTAAGMLFSMTAYESLKQWLFPAITVWQSHIITIFLVLNQAPLVRKYP